MKFGIRLCESLFAPEKRMNYKRQMAEGCHLQWSLLRIGRPRPLGPRLQAPRCEPVDPFI